jgi:hypothetical protein
MDSFTIRQKNHAQISPIRRLYLNPTANSPAVILVAEQPVESTHPGYRLDLLVAESSKSTR